MIRHRLILPVDLVKEGSSSFCTAFPLFDQQLANTIWIARFLLQSNNRYAIAIRFAIAIIMRGGVASLRGRGRQHTPWRISLWEFASRT